MLINVVVPSSRLRTKMSSNPFESDPEIRSRSSAPLRNATNRPSRLNCGSLLRPSPVVPSSATLNVLIVSNVRASRGSATLRPRQIGLTVAAVTDDSFAYSMTTDKGDSSYRLLHINDGAPTGWRKKQKIDVQVLSQLTCESAAKNSKGEKSSSQLP